MSKESTGFDDNRERMLAQVRADMPSAVHAFVKAYSTNSLRAAINAHCLECCYLDRIAIRGCTATNCGLWNIRPFQRKRHHENRVTPRKRVPERPVLADRIHDKGECPANVSRGKKGP